MSPAPRAAYRNTTVALAAFDRAERSPDATAIHLEDGGHVGYADIVAEARSLAAGLRTLGLRAGDAVGFQLPNWREAVAIDIAAALLGLVLVPVIPIYRERELAFILGDARVRVMLVPGLFQGVDYPAMIERVRATLPHLAHLVVVRGQRAYATAHDYAQLVAAHAHAHAAPAPAQVDPDSLKILLYTSGTTGNPKAVRHSHNTMTRAFDNGREAWAIGAGDIMLMPSPVTHISGFANGIELPFLSQAQSAFMERWDADRAIDFILRTGATLCLSATPFLRELVDRAAARGETLPTLRLFACGGASVPPGLIRAAHRTLASCRAFRVYGSTEAPLVSAGFQQPEDEELAAETDGRCFNWEVRIQDEHGNALPEGHDGEIVVRGPAMMLGYADAEQSREAFTPDGFFRTGDIGHIGARDAIVITDRKKDIIIRGGENLSAREIEDVLHLHPAIAEAAVVAMPHERLGEGVCAWLVLRAGNAALTLDELRPHLAAAGLAKQKWPERIELVAELPKTASGKVRKDVLRSRARDWG